MVDLQCVWEVEGEFVIMSGLQERDDASSEYREDMELLSRLKQVL